MLAQVWCAAIPADRPCACIVFSHRFFFNYKSICNHEELAACLGACRGGRVNSRSEQVEADCLYGRVEKFMSIFDYDADLSFFVIA